MSQRGTGTRDANGVDLAERGSTRRDDASWWGGELTDPDRAAPRSRRRAQARSAGPPAGAGDSRLDAVAASGPPAGAGCSRLDAVAASGPPAGAGDSRLDAVAASGPSVRPGDGGAREPAPPPDLDLVDAPVQEGPLDATEFSSATMLRRLPAVPRHGWRRAVYSMSGGIMNPGPSPKERAHAALVERARTPIVESRRIAVISRKGGVGKTTTTLMLGHTFATWRGDRVVALDGNPDAGSLGYRVPRETTATVTDLLRAGSSLARYADIRGHTNQAPSKLEVVAADDDDDAMTSAIGEAELIQAVRILERHYNLILLDSGTGILDRATQGILRLADQIVIVTVPSLDGARAASLTLDWLDVNGYGWLVRDAVAVMNQNRADTVVDTARIVDHFRRRCRGCVVLPWDPRLEAGAEIGLDEVGATTRAAYLELAAAVADGFGDQPQRVHR
jgi:putative peptide zinc metalloprotease protein